MPITTNHYWYLSGTLSEPIASKFIMRSRFFNDLFRMTKPKKMGCFKSLNPVLPCPKNGNENYSMRFRFGRVAMRERFWWFDLNFPLRGTKVKGQNASFNIWKSGNRKCWTDSDSWFSETTLDNPKMELKNLSCHFPSTILMFETHVLFLPQPVAVLIAMQICWETKTIKFTHELNVVVCGKATASFGVHRALPSVQIAHDNNPWTKNHNFCENDHWGVNL